MREPPTLIRSFPRKRESRAACSDSSPWPLGPRLRGDERKFSVLRPPSSVFLDDLGPFRTTRFAIEDALRFHKANPLSLQLEIETYTWDVLPPELRQGSRADAIARELGWVLQELH